MYICSIKNFITKINISQKIKGLDKQTVLEQNIIF